MFLLARYASDGSLDTSFGGSGAVTTSVPSQGRALGVAIQDDDKIVAAGGCFAFARYNGDGSLDADFGAGGTVSHCGQFVSFGSGEVHSLALQSDGKIVAAGRAQNNNGSTFIDFALARLRGVGSDTTPPQTVITAGPSGPTASTDASFSFDSNEPGSTFECKLESDPGYTACTSPKSYTSLGHGGHTFSVRATDQAGNLNPSPATRTWTVDTVPTRHLDHIRPAKCDHHAIRRVRVQLNRDQLVL